ncbi:MAG: hypothetical protein OSB18_05550 [SAR324 cluster bacterium]|nr:hypothetical protein [SAR324 cluster bacterium]
MGGKRQCGLDGGPQGSLSKTSGFVKAEGEQTPQAGIRMSRKGLIFDNMTSALS